MLQRPVFSSARALRHSSAAALRYSRPAARAHAASRILAPLAPSFAGAVRHMSQETRASIDAAVKSAPVVLFMKGTPEMPQCGFSRGSVQILGMQGLDPSKFAAYNVLENEELRAGIKEYSEWPTIPQLYVENEFVGGYDILMQMHQDGQLAKILEDKDLLVPGEEEPAQS